MELVLLDQDKIDSICMSILKETYPHPHSIDYLSRKLDLPPAKLKKKIKELSRKGLLQEEIRVYNIRGGWTSFYRSKISPSL